MFTVVTRQPCEQAGKCRSLDDKPGFVRSPGESQLGFAPLHPCLL